VADQVVVTRPRFDAGALIEIDLRSLALFRIGIALTLLVDVALRAPDLDALYGARGVLPPELARTLWDLRAAVSPFTWVAAWPPLLWAGFALLAVAALGLALGVYPRLAAVAAWGLLAALQDRNLGLYMSGDRYLLLMLMWCILLPTGARLSLRPAEPGVTRIRSWAGAGLLLQVVLVYVFTGLKKTGAEWFDGTALWYALSQGEFVSAAGRWVRLQPALTVPLSYGVKWVEIFGPLLVFSPWRNAAARMIAIGLFWTLHLGLQICQAIGVFQLVGLAAWLAFLPSAHWDRRATPATSEHAQRRIRNPRWSEWLAVVPIAYLVILMGSTGYGVLVGRPYYPVPVAIDRIAVPLHLQEGWAMFAELPPSTVWFLAPGRLANGADVEVLGGAPLDRRKPSDIQSAQRGFRWTMYFVNVIQRGTRDPAFQATHPALLDYLCREWNARSTPERRLDSVSLVMVIEAMPRPGSTGPTPSQPYVLATRDCPPATSDRGDSPSARP
jgi:hypothetical protein